LSLKNFIDLCRCPLCQSNLSIDHTQSLVQCPNDHQFNLVDHRIPILLPDAEQSKGHNTKNSNIETSKSFSMQWQMYKEGDKIWGWTKSKFEDLFQKNSGISLNALSGKRVLDLGCGHGYFSTIIAENGAHVVGFDISNGFLNMENHLDDRIRQNLNFIQGDVFNFPLKEEIADIVWCSGVLHHTPNTKQAFNHVYRVVKKGGRFYLWLYKNVYYTPLLKLIRSITTKVPGSWLVVLCYFMAPFFILTKFLLTVSKLNYRKFENRSLRENALSIHDTLAPPFRWHHEKEEVIQWFEEAGFKNITVSEDSALGYGIYADR